MSQVLIFRPVETTAVRLVGTAATPVSWRLAGLRLDRVRERPGLPERPRAARPQPAP